MENTARLTKAQRTVLSIMGKNKGSFLRPHLKSTGTRCYRLMDENFNPVVNIRDGVVSRLINKMYLEKNDGVFVLKVQNRA